MFDFRKMSDFRKKTDFRNISDFRKKTDFRKNPEFLFLPTATPAPRRSLCHRSQEAPASSFMFVGAPYKALKGLIRILRALRSSYEGP